MSKSNLDSLNQPFFNHDDNQQSSSLNPKCWLITIFITSVCCLIVSALAMVFALQAKSNKFDASTLPADLSLPRRYSVDHNYILPPTNQMNIGSCWCFATIYLLESQYHYQGVEEGYLDENEYVQFSKQSFFTWLGDQCHLHPEVKACHYGGLMSNSSEDQQIESVYYFAKAWKDIYKAVLPESICNYTQKPDDMTNWSYMTCPGMYEAIEQNPIEWSYESIDIAYNLQTAKELLFKAKRPLGIGAPLPSMNYYIPCENSPFSEKDQCKNKEYPCPQNAFHGQYCYKFEIDGRQQDGVFLSNIDTRFMSELGGHAMNLVGYNDDWVYRNRYQGFSTVAPLKGGLILHNSWRPEGHSVDYYMGRQSEENEAVLCPNHKSPFNWIPTDLKSVQDALSQGKEALLKIPTNIIRVRGNGTTQFADPLNCVNTDYCNNESTYFLLKKNADEIDANVTTNSDGTNDITFIEAKKDRSTDILTIQGYPFWALHTLFRPKDEIFVSNDPNGCGYWMLPYHTIETMSRINWDFLDNFRVFDFKVKFEPHSYLKHKDSSKYNTTLLKLSTKRKDTQSFDGPLPYDYIF